MSWRRFATSLGRAPSVLNVTVREEVIGRGRGARRPDPLGGVAVRLPDRGGDLPGGLRGGLRAVEIPRLQESPGLLELPRGPEGLEAPLGDLGDRGPPLPDC